ncbi:ATP-binding protein [Gemmata sp.]|uniref:ATP-binding protein n=1 Tax=Gemmata sp. TaxID=1914242 RepID=UPI003F713F78
MAHESRSGRGGFFNSSLCDPRVRTLSGVGPGPRSRPTPATTSAADAARPLLAARRHEFSQLLPTEPLWAEGDAGRLARVAVNLPTNAAKYTLTGGRVRMSVGWEGGEAVVRVLDNGPGIPRTSSPRCSTCSPRWTGR